MSRFKAKKRSYFKSGLALCGEKKIYEKNYATIDLAGAADNFTYSWHKVPIPFSEITKGTDKDERVGNKIYVRYITFDLEVYTKDSSSPADFPYVRIIYAKDRAGNTIINDDLPTTRLGRPKVSNLNILSDNCIGMDSDYPGHSVSLKAIAKTTKTFKMFTSLQFNESGTPQQAMKFP